ncbi:Alpha/Beta hydrolase protein [Podospora australis]|uniref:Alpha/Beta hydrolase protein n=1 Tax=Podospora australis TaxID=1536484 RepID=A0AAN7AGF2_9PEZI|nr:Alpha/Beta hydrolase protein [Podospora australis]
MSLNTSWSFTPFPPFPATILPNVAYWNATNQFNNLTYQIGVSWPFEWDSRNVTNKTALSMYVIDGNALGLTAAEAFKRRQPVSFNQPDSLVVSIGYPLSDSVYDLAQRAIDFRPPLPTPQMPPSGADDFIAFIDGSLRPWIKTSVFPNVKFGRDALFGHSFGGLFVTYALVSNPNLFDTYFVVSPALNWNNGSILDDVTARFGNGIDIPGSWCSSCPDGDQRAPWCLDRSKAINTTKPAVAISYGTLETFPVRTRTETEAEFQVRKAVWRSYDVGTYSHELFDRLEGSGRFRDVALKEYYGSDHSTLGASALNDGVDYFIDW